MKSNIHPDYDYVVFQDVSCGEMFRVRSTVKTDKTIKWEDGKEYPLFPLETSSVTHPFFTGGSKLEAAEGRIAKFRKRYSKEK